VTVKNLNQTELWWVQWREKGVVEQHGCAINECPCIRDTSYHGLGII